MSALRNIILHYHLFKCAGTSVEQVLRSNFGRRFATWDKSHPAAKISPAEIGDYILKHPGLDAISSHQLTPPPPVIEGVQILPILFMRHPLDRLLSTYRFTKNRASDVPGDQLASKKDLKEYIRTLLEQGTASHASNFYVFSLTDQRDPATGRLLPVGPDAHFERAKQFLLSLPLIGVVERFNESATAFQNHISRDLPEFRFPIVEANVSSPRNTTIEMRLDQLKHELGDDLWATLVSRNAPDFELYSIACRQLDNTSGGEAIANG